MPNDNNNYNALYWIPTGIGAGIGIRRMTSDISAANPRSWLQDPSGPSRAIRDQVVSTQMLKTAVSSTNSLDTLNQIALESTWKRIPSPWARRAVAEASRASLLQEARMPIESIDALTRNILAPKGFPDFFDQARQNVIRAGDPQTFLQTLNRYLPDPTNPFAGQAAPGVFFGQPKLKQMFQAAQQNKRTVNWISAPIGSSQDWWKSSQITDLEKTTLSKFTNQLGAQTTVSSLAQYPNNITMAQLKLGVQGLPDPIKLNVPLHPSRYRKPQAEYVMNKIYTGIPSRGGEMKTWGDYYVQQAQQSLIPDIQQAATQGMSKKDLKYLIKQKTTAFETQMTRYMMWTPGVRHPGLDFMNRVNAEMVAAPELSDNVIRNVLDKPNIDKEMGLLFKEHGLYPGISGGEIVAGRMVGKRDPRSLWAYGADFPFERRPLQFLREFAPTQQALTAMESRPAAFGFSRKMPFLATPARQELIKGGVVAPQLLVGYALQGGAAENVLKRTGLATEELLTRKELMPMFETERITQMKLGLHESVGQGENIAKWLEQAVQGEVTPFPLKPGQQIGYELKTGKSLLAADVPGVKQELIGAQFTLAGKGEEAAQIFIRESHSTQDYVKLFGQLKVTTRGRDAAYMFKVEKDLGIRMAKDLDAFTFADELRKNRSLLKQQMVSGLGMLSEKRLSKMNDLVMQLEIAKGQGNISVIQSIEKRLDAYDRSMKKTAWLEMQDFRTMNTAKIEKMLPDELAVLRKGKEWGLDIRLVGGSLEEAKDILPGNILSEARKIAGKQGLVHPSGLVIGAATSHVGAYRHTMGGGILEGGIRGSMEPRGILGLLQQNWMVGDKNVAHMLAAENLRLMTSYSTDIDEVLKISRSLSGEEIPGLEKVSAWAAEGKAKDIPIRKAGYMLDLGVPVQELGGATSVYVPGEEAMHRFAQFRGNAGEILQTDLAKKYNQLAKAATQVRNLGNETTAISALNLSAKELTKAVMQEAGQSMYGRGSGSNVYGALRGKRLASQFLAVSAIDEMVSKATVGMIEVSERSGREMLGELERAATTAEERAFISSQRKAFLSGETIPGQVGRHPFIGPYSIQPTMIKKATSVESLNEYFTKVPAYMDEPVNVIGEAQKVLGTKITANVSPMVGLAADYDDDQLIISLIGDEKTAKATEELMRGGQYTREYKKFAAESNVLKQLAKNQLGTTAAPVLDDINQLIAGSTKLRIAQAETAGISLSLSEAKLAMSYYKPEMAPKFNLIAEMMEQQIISGKHMKDVTKSNIARSVSSAINEIGSMNTANVELNELSRITTEMFGPQLQKGIELQSPDLGSWTLKTDPKQLWQEAQGALRQGREKTGIITRYKQMARGRINLANLNIDEVIEQIEGARAGKLDSLSMLAASGLETPVRGKMSNAISNAIRGLNQARKELGSVPKTWYRPALLGLAGTAAAVMLLGGVKSQPLNAPPRPAQGDQHRFVPQNQQQGQMMLRGITPSEKDLRPESLPLSKSVSGEPTPPTSIGSPATYMTNSIPRNYRIMARATADDFAPDYNSVVQALRPAIGDANMRINFKDNRINLTSQKIADLLEEA